MQRTRAVLITVAGGIVLVLGFAGLAWPSASEVVLIAVIIVALTTAIISLALADDVSATRRRVTEEITVSASQERNRLVAALNSSVDAVVAVDVEGRVTFANRSAERLFVRDQDQLVGNPFLWILPNEGVLD